MAALRPNLQPPQALRMRNVCALHEHTAHTHRKLRINSKITNEFVGFKVGVSDPGGASPLGAGVTPRTLSKWQAGCR